MSLPKDPIDSRHQKNSQERDVEKMKNKRGFSSISFPVRIGLLCISDSSLDEPDCASEAVIADHDVGLDQFTGAVDIHQHSEGDQR